MYLLRILRNHLVGMLPFKILGSRFARIQIGSTCMSNKIDCLAKALQNTLPTMKCPRSFWASSQLPLLKTQKWKTVSRRCLYKWSLLSTCMEWCLQNSSRSIVTTWARPSKTFQMSAAEGLQWQSFLYDQYGLISYLGKRDKDGQEHW